jgi:ketosteroid isomerase-like protein
MTSHRDPLSVAMAWCRLTGGESLAGLDDLLTGESLVHGLSRLPLRGAAAVQRVAAEIARVYPGRSCELLDSMVEGDRAAVRWKTTHPARPWHLPGSPTELDGITLCTVRDGRIVELYTSAAHWWV